MTLAVNKQLRHVFSVISGATPESGNADYWGGDILWVTPQDISSLDGYWLQDTRRLITQAGYESCGTTTAPRYSVVLTKRAPIGQVALLAHEACSNQGCFLLIPRRETDTRFYYYWLAVQTQYLQILGSGSTFMELSIDEIKSLRIPHPSPTLQRIIADYLDRETARLDALIAEKERVLELLAEKRRALITRAVTRGLDPRAPLRDSGVPWLGDIPVQWEIRRLKFLSPQITVGIVVTPAKYYELTGVPCLRSLNVREDGLSDADLVFISEESNLLHSKSIIRAGDLVAVRSGQPGTTAVVDQRFDGANCVDLIVIRRTNTLNSTFLAHFLNSDPAKMQFLSGSAGAIQQHFNIGTAADLLVPVPPPKEQREIVATVAKKTDKVNVLIAATERTIALLRERRSALIASAVTGRTDVGGVA